MLSGYRQELYNQDQVCSAFNYTFFVLFSFFFFFLFDKWMSSVGRSNHGICPRQVRLCFRVGYETDTFTRD